MSALDPSTPALLATPPAFIDESPNSWVQRICAGHGYSMSRLMKVVKIRPLGHDWDIGLTDDKWHWLVGTTRLSKDSCSDARRAFGELGCFRGLGGFLRVEKGRPVTAWCLRCWEMDEIPYLRWHWRLKSLACCPLHGEIMRVRCPHCGSMYGLAGAILVPRSLRNGVFNLSACAQCGMNLRDEVGFESAKMTTIKNELDGASIAKTAALLRHDDLMAIYVRPYFDLETRRTIFARALLKGITAALNGSRNASFNVNFFFSVMRNPYCSVWEGNPALREVPPDQWPKIKWSASLDAICRPRLAKALAIVRQEKNRMRTTAVSEKLRQEHLGDVD